MIRARHFKRRKVEPRQEGNSGCLPPIMRSEAKFVIKQLKLSPPWIGSLLCLKGNSRLGALFSCVQQGRRGAPLDQVGRDNKRTCIGTTDS